MSAILPNPETAFGRAYKPILDALGLTYTQWIIIVALWEQDGQKGRAAHAGGGHRARPGGVHDHPAGRGESPRQSRPPREGWGGQ